MFCIKSSRLSDELHTLLAKSEMTNNISWFCKGCDKVFPQAGAMLRTFQFMESKLNESDVKLSNLSKTVDDVADRLSKVDHMCQSSSGLSTTNITTHSNPDLQIAVRVNEENKIEKLKFNVVIHNFPESDKESPYKWKQEELDKSNDICTLV